MGVFLQLEEVNKDETLDDLARQIRLIAILSGISEDEVSRLPLPEYQERAKRLEFLSQVPSQGRLVVADKYTLGGMVLVPVTDVRKMVVGQYVDYQEYGDEAWVERLSVFLIPKGKTYTEGYDVLDVQNAIREHLSVTEALNLYAFFLTGLRTSMDDILTSSIRGAKRMIPRRRERNKVTGLLRRLRTILRQGGVG